LERARKSGALREGRQAAREVDLFLMGKSELPR
jgi:hypothetical protein